MSADAFSSGKGHRDENFPVASFVLEPQHRAPVMAFYRFARAADDVSDHPSAGADDKLAQLERMRATLAGESDGDQVSLDLRRVLDERGLRAMHGLDLLKAFKRDVTQLRYADWADLMDYCRYSAMPVGRFVLDVHGESESTWPANDALCAALQVINHLQDCGEDFQTLDRVYIPLDVLQAAGISVEALAEPKASPPLREVISGLAGRTGELLDQSRSFPRQVRDGRLAYEVALIQRLAEDLVGKLKQRDPLSERVHHRPWEVAGLALLAGRDWLGRGRGAAAADAARPA